MRFNGLLVILISLHSTIVLCMEESRLKSMQKFDVIVVGLGAMGSAAFTSLQKEIKSPWYRSIFSSTYIRFISW